jgi:hypothetical protein
MTEDIRAALVTQEHKLTDATTSTDQEITQVATRMEKIGLSSAIEDNRQLGSDAAEVIEDLEAERASLHSTRVLMENLFSETHFLRTGQRIRNVQMSDSGQLLVGLLNTQGRSDQIQQDISNIKANKGGKGVVGIAEGLDINSFFK